MKYAGKMLDRDYLFSSKVSIVRSVHSPLMVKTCILIRNDWANETKDLQESIQYWKWRGHPVIEDQRQVTYYS